MYTIETATRIANYGADKMNETNYTLFAPIFDVDPNVWGVAKNDDTDTTYRVELAEDGTFECNCPFFVENSVCKHGVYLKRELREQARADEMSEKLSDPDYVDFAKANGFLP